MTRPLITDFQGLLFQRQLRRALDYVGGQQGWAVYNHAGADQQLSTGVRSVYTIDEGAKIEAFLPFESEPLFASNAITGVQGDSIVVKVQNKFTPDDATASQISFDVDIGGAVGIVEEQDFPVIKGAMVEHKQSWTFVAYTLDTWQANGGLIYVTADGPGVLSDKRVLIAKVSQA